MMSWREIGVRVRLIVGVALIAMGLALPAVAQSDQVSLNIPPQELASALAALAEQANVQVLYASELAGSRLTKGVVGTMSPEEGVRQVLEGTGLEYVFTDTRTVTLQKAPAPAALAAQAEAPGVSISPVKQKPVKVPEIVVKEVRERDDAKTYVAEESSVATRTDTPIKDVPQSIQVITRKVIEEQRTFRLQNSLESVSGINAADSSASLYENLIIRGFAATDRSYFRNGLIDPFAQFTASDTYNIRRIEVLKGPAAVLYGQGDPGGVINLVTTKPLADAAYSANTTIGNFNFYRSELDATGPLNASKTVLYRLNVAGQRANSFIDFANRDLAAIAPSVTWLLGTRTTLTVDADYMRRWSNDPYGLPAQGTVWGNINGNIPRNRSVTLGDHGSLNRTSYRIGYDLTHQFNDQWSIRNVYRHSIVEDDRNTLFVTPDSLDADQRTLNRTQLLQPAVARRHAHSMVTNVVGHLRMFDMDHTLLTGVEFRQEKTDQFVFTGDLAPTLDLFAPNYSLLPVPAVGGVFQGQFQGDNKTAAFYLQDQITILPSLKFMGGLRFDYVHQSTQSAFESHSSDNHAVSPRLGLVYQPIEPLSLYTSWTKGFQPSSPATRNGNGTGDLFKPERSTQYEIGMKTFLMDNRLSATLAWFHLTRENLVTPNPDPALSALGFSVQTGEQRSQGIELDVTAQMTPGWNVIAGYAYTDAEVTKDTDTALLNRRLPNVPYNKFTIWSTYHFQEGPLKGFGVGGGLFAYSSRTASLSGNPIDMPAYVRADAALYYNHALEQGNWLGAKGFNVALNIKNLLDQRYVATSYNGSQFFFYGEPLTVLGTVGLRF
ncbi:TonB-dependent siderophore receptor [Nitrospira lenta]|uniref:Ferrichrome iron receptor n=1 Tax=Nitrospira lenta TaxID=1436998 RepID=A0A330L7C4_9BACT|nr:TonB-dependent receptor [Nitrospira lenta]SPP65582.1 Ferrichrome iron receptor [Nitrospira lenta]